MRKFIFSLVIAFVQLSIVFSSDGSKTFSGSQACMFENPIGVGADPWVVTASGKYWYCGSFDNSICLFSSDSLHTILKGEKTSIYAPPEGKEFSKEIWAPELHYVRGKWYVYFAADDGKNENHRMYAIEGGSDPENPLCEPYIFKGQIADSSNKWAIDGTIFEYQYQLYFLWSGWPGDENVRQCLYISKMSDPFTISGDRFAISCPEMPWELNGTPNINEGPEVIVKDSSVHVIYSASGSWTDDYCLGRLSCFNGNLLDKNSWKKDGPVFYSTDSVFGPGHASFVQNPKTGKWWIVYHAARQKGSGWDRNIRIQPFIWKQNVPDFGIPVSPNIKIADQ